MKQSNYQKYGQLADDIIDAACAGDATAIDHVLCHYDRYINKLCTRTLYEKDGSSYVRVDEVMKSHLRTLIIIRFVSTHLEGRKA